MSDPLRQYNYGDVEDPLRRQQDAFSMSRSLTWTPAYRVEEGLLTLLEPSRVVSPSTNRMTGDPTTESCRDAHSQVNWDLREGSQTRVSQAYAHFLHEELQESLRWCRTIITGPLLVCRTFVTGL